jgi:hypothetical protein
MKHDPMPKKIKTAVCGTEQVRAVKGSGAKECPKNTLNSDAVPMNKLKKG